RDGLVLGRHPARADRPRQHLCVLHAVRDPDRDQLVRLALLDLVDAAHPLHLDPDRRRRGGARRCRRRGRRSQRAAAALARPGRRGARLSRHDPALYRLRRLLERDAVRRDAAVDRALRHRLQPRGGRHQRAVRAPEQLHHRAHRDRGLGGHPVARGAVLRRVPAPLRDAERRLRGPRRGPVLRLLRGDADPDVHHHRRLGRAEPRLCGGEVLPLYAARLAAHADRAALPLQQVRGQLRDPRLAQAATLARGADPALLRLPLRVRGEGADVAGAHLAAGRAHRGAHRRLGGAGGDPAQARRLRLRPLQPADPARCLPHPRPHDDRALAHRRGLHRAGRAGAGRHEAPDRVLLDLAHGLRDARLLHLQRVRRRGRAGADDLARLRLGRDVPVRRRALRPHAHAHDRRLRRRGEHHAALRLAHDALRHGELRPARDERLRRRVHGHHGRDEGEFLARLRRRDDAHLGRGVHALDVQAGHVRRRRQRPRRRAAGPERPRGAGARAARGRGPRHGRLPAALHRRDARLGERAASPRRDLQDMNPIALIDHLPALPEVLLLAGACAVMLTDARVRTEHRQTTFVLAQVVLLLCALATLWVLRVQWQANYSRLLIFNGLFISDVMSHVLELTAYLATSVALVYSRQYLQDRGLLRGEFITLLLFALLGMMILMSAASFLTVYLGLELMSLCLYALVALNRDSALSTEAAMKYFVL